MGDPKEKKEKKMKRKKKSLLGMLPGGQGVMVHCTEFRRGTWCDDESSRTDTVLFPTNANQAHRGKKGQELGTCIF